MDKSAEKKFAKVVDHVYLHVIDILNNSGWKSLSWIRYKRIQDKLKNAKKWEKS